MPDISMCLNETCPDRRLCYRFMAVPDPNRQSYGDFAPEPEAMRCESFRHIDTAPTKLREEINAQIPTNPHHGGKI